MALREEGLTEPPDPGEGSSPLEPREEGFTGPPDPGGESSPPVRRVDETAEKMQRLLASLGPKERAALWTIQMEAEGNVWPDAVAQLPEKEDAAARARRERKARMAELARVQEEAARAQEEASRAQEQAGKVQEEAHRERPELLRLQREDEQEQCWQQREAELQRAWGIQRPASLDSTDTAPEPLDAGEESGLVVAAAAAVAAVTGTSRHPVGIEQEHALRVMVDGGDCRAEPGPEGLGDGGDLLPRPLESGWGHLSPWLWLGWAPTCYLLTGCKPLTIFFYYWMPPLEGQPARRRMLRRKLQAKALEPKHGTTITRRRGTTGRAPTRWP